MPTPSVPVTKMGSSCQAAFKSNKLPKLPISDKQPDQWVPLVKVFIDSTNDAAVSISTPDSL